MEVVEPQGFTSTEAHNLADINVGKPAECVPVAEAAGAGCRRLGALNKLSRTRKEGIRPCSTPAGATSGTGNCGCAIRSCGVRTARVRGRVTRTAVYRKRSMQRGENDCKDHPVSDLLNETLICPPKVGAG